MSNHGHDNNQDHGNQLVEGSGIKAKPVLIFLVVLGLATAAVFVIIKGLEIGFAKMDEMNPQQPATALDGGRKLPPAPRLQGAPEPDPNKPNDPNATKESLLPLDEMKKYREEIEKKAESYGWVDENGGIAHLPIERAKEMMAEKGLPKLSDAMISEFEAAEKARKLVMNAGSSSGRGIKSQRAASVSQPAAAGENQTAQPAGTEQKAAPQAEAKAQSAGAKQ